MFGQIVLLHLPSFLFQVAKEEGGPQTGEKSLRKDVFTLFPTGWSTFSPIACARLLKVDKLLIKLIKMMALLWRTLPEDPA